MNKPNLCVVAECGVAWPDFAHALEMIFQSKKAGADYVKFQLFNADVIEESPHREKLEPKILGETQVEALKTRADEVKIGFILTPMYLKAVDLAAKHADFLKIRFADHENEPLIDKALATGKTLLMSVPYKPLVMTRFYHPRIKYLYCIPRYPPHIEDFNLELAATCQGFSSHFPYSHMVCDVAYAINRLYKQCFIEKHVMFKPTRKRRKKPLDAEVSVTFEQLHSLVGHFKLIEQMKRMRFL